MQTEIKNRIMRANTVQPEKGPNHRQLASFVGRWKVEGQNSSTAPGAAGLAVTGTETYEWLDGEFFLVNRFERTQADGSRFTGLGFIGFDEGADAYIAHLISNTGHLRVYEVEVSEAEMKFNGEAERASLRLSDDQSNLAIQWEHRTGDGPWQPLCDLKAFRLNS